MTERPTPAMVAAVVLAADRLEGQADAVAARLAERIHPELEGFPRHAAVTRSTTRAIRSLVASFAELVRRAEPDAAAPLPPAAVAYVHDHVRHGIDLSVALRAYRLGHEELWRHWTGLLDAAGLSAAELLASRDATGSALFGYMDDVTERVIDEYRAERDRWARSAATRRAEVVRALLAGEASDLAAASSALRIDLGATLVGAVLWVDDADGALEHAPAGGAGERLEAAAVELAAEAGAGRPLTVAAGRRTLWAWFVARDAERAPTPRPRGDGVGVAVGEPGAGAVGFRRTHEEAAAARRVVRRAPGRAGVARWGDVAVAGLLTADADLAERFAERELGELGAAGDQAGLLRATLLAHLDAARAAGRAATDLGVHANTVGNRLRRCTELLGRPLDERPLELHAALRVRATLDASAGPSTASPPR